MLSYLARVKSKRGIFMKTIKKIIPYLLVQLLIFYFIPTVIKDTGSAMVTMLVMIPILSFITSLILGYRDKLQPLFPLCVMLVFIPSIYFFYNESAWIYILVYGIISFVGNLIGSIISKNTDKKVLH